jgi:hypothetical protein
MQVLLDWLARPGIWRVLERKHPSTWQPVACGGSPRAAPTRSVRGVAENPWGSPPPMPPLPVLIGIAVGLPAGPAEAARAGAPSNRCRREEGRYVVERGEASDKRQRVMLLLTAISAVAAVVAAVAAIVLLVG